MIGNGWDSNATGMPPGYDSTTYPRLIAYDDRRDDPRKAGVCRVPDRSGNLHEWSRRERRDRRVNILIVDDEATLRRTLRITLESMGHRVAEAATQAQARNALES